MKSLHHYIGLLLLGILLHYPFLLSAQNYLLEEIDGFQFWESPIVDGKQVTVIKDWLNKPDQPKTSLAATYTFRVDGLLARVEFEEEEWIITYQEGNRTKEVIKNGRRGTTRYIFAYLNDRDVMEKRINDQIWKTIFYKDEQGKLIERKAFYYGDDVPGLHYRLLDRTVFHYDDQDRVVGEMEYVHYVNGNTIKNKTIHDHGPDRKNKVNIIYYPNEKFGSIKKMQYDDKDRLIGSQHIFDISEDYVSERETIVYKGEQIYKIEKECFTETSPPHFHSKETKIYKNDLLIYTKSSDQSGWISESNFQYITE